ncbi:MAG: hypothetical protein ACLQVL_36795 [Terriglobia bacterium]
MSRWQIALILFRIAFLCFVAGGLFFLYPHVTALLDSYQQAAPSSGKADAVLDKVNRPCATEAEKAAGKDHPCGTLANIDKAVVKVGDLLVTSQRQEQDVAKAAQANMGAVNDLAGHLNTVADKLSGTATAATGTLQQAQTDLATLDGSIAATKPLLTHADAAVSDLDAAVNENRKRIALGLDNLNVISGQTALITTDVHHYTHPILNPDPCTTRKCRAGRLFGAAEGYLGFAGLVDSAKNLFTPLPVKVTK